MRKKSDSCSLRRSGRQRKALYGTLNQSCIFGQIGDYIITRSRDDSNGRRLVDSASGLSSSGLQRRHSRDVIAVNMKNRIRESDDEEILDIYSRVKRRKRRVSAPTEEIFDAEESNQSSLTAEVEGATRNGLSTKKASPAEESSSDEDSGEEQIQRRYFLRQQKVAPERFKFDFAPHKKSMEVVVKRTNDYEQRAFQSPAHKRSKHDDYAIRRKTYRRKLENAGSSSTSSSDISDDEKKFERRKCKSLDRSRNRFLPVNMSPRVSKLSASLARQKGVGGAMGADLDPMTLDTSIGFKDIGGLAHHLQSLKEMILFPMMYSEVFEKFKITPPRGVLFYGPPGTGKTLVARALANECSRGDRKLAFFMRKGADCLSKWVGESERQLRLLFDQAYMMRPSIIFFDEIDGLAPVRSSRQDQIHSSIVSTLLALMDGLDQRGEVIVIGATNRLDAIDPALRRPGRFDRELLFKLPDAKDRCQILKIHTFDWNPPLDELMVDKLSMKLVGYCGADIKGLCTEAALVALRKKYPQIYTSDKKLVLDTQAITITENDFEVAMLNLVPSTNRTASFSSKPLPSHLVPLLGSNLKFILDKISDEFRSKKTIGPDLDSLHSQNSYSEILDVFDVRRRTFGQKMIICADGPDHGQTTYLAPAVFHCLDHLPVFVLGLPQIFSSSYKSPEEAVSEILSTAAKFSPCVLFLPTVDVLMRVIPHSAWYTLTSMVQSWCTSLSVLIFATSNEPHRSLDEEIKVIFGDDTSVAISAPYADARRKFFVSILKDEALKIPVRSAETTYEPLPEAGPAPAKPLTETEMKKFFKVERQTMRELRIFLREILNRLIRDRRFLIFSKPVDAEQAPDYSKIVTEPMDLSTMMCKIDQHKYENVEQFLSDIDLITGNALEYNPAKDQTEKLIRHRACALRDVANALIEQEYDSDFEMHCKEVENFRKTREISDRFDQPPAFVYTAPLKNNSSQHHTMLKQVSLHQPDFPKKEAAVKCENENQAKAAAIVKKYKARRRLTLEMSTTGTDEHTNDGMEGSDEENALDHAKSCQLRIRTTGMLGSYMASLLSPYQTMKKSFRTKNSSSNSHGGDGFTHHKRKDLIYDEAKWNKLLDSSVAVTSDWSVAQLEKLFLRMMQDIDRHVFSCDKNELIDDLDAMVRSCK